jgi:hypothetical protein
MTNEESQDPRPAARPKETPPPQLSQFEETRLRIEKEREATKGKRGLKRGIIFSVFALMSLSYMFGDIDATEIRQNFLTGDLKQFKLATCSFMDENPVCEKVDGQRWLGLFMSLAFIATAIYSFFIFSASPKEPPTSEENETKV